MQNFELKQRTGSEPADDNRVDRAQEAAFLEVQTSGFLPRSLYIIDTGGSEVSALNDW